MPFSATLLVGGKSTRMGRDKATLPYSGKLLWEHQIDTLKAAGAAEVIISGPAGGAYAGAEHKVVPDLVPDCGPLGGLHAALNQARYDHLLLLAVDLPDMTPSYLQRLWAECSNAVGAIPRLEGNYEPLAAFYPRAILPLVEEEIARGDYSFQKLLAKAEARGMVKAISISEVERTLFRNWNTP